MTKQEEIENNMKDVDDVSVYGERNVSMLQLLSGKVEITLGAFSQEPVSSRRDPLPPSQTPHQN